MNDERERRVHTKLFCVWWWWWWRRWYGRECLSLFAFEATGGYSTALWGSGFCRSGGGAGGGREGGREGGGSNSTRKMKKKKKKKKKKKNKQTRQMRREFVWLIYTLHYFLSISLFYLTVYLLLYALEDAGDRKFFIEICCCYSFTIFIHFIFICLISFQALEEGGDLGSSSSSSRPSTFPTKYNDPVTSTSKGSTASMALISSNAAATEGKTVVRVC